MGENGNFQPLQSTHENILQTVSNVATVTINDQQEIAYRWFAVDFFTKGLHTHSAVARLPLHQLGFLVVSSFTAVDCSAGCQT